VLIFDQVLKKHLAVANPSLGFPLFFDPCLVVASCFLQFSIQKMPSGRQTFFTTTNKKNTLWLPSVFYDY